MSDVPAGWRSVQLKDAGTWLSGGTPYTDEPRYWSGDIAWISAASLKNFHISHSDRRVTEQGAHAGTRLIPPGTPLFVVRGMSLKNEFRVGVTERQVAFGQDCKAILPAPGIDGKFLALALKARSSQILEMVDEAGHGTGRLPTDMLSKLDVGIPPPAEQQRITEILDAADSQVRAIQDLMDKFSAVRLGVIGDLLEAGQAGDHEFGYLGDMVRETALGAAARGTDKAGPVVTLLKMGSIQDGMVTLDQTETLSALLLSNLSDILLRDGDLLLNTRNTPELVGKVGAWHDEVSGVVPDNNLLIMRFKPGINTDYVCAQLTYGEPSRYVRTLATGTTSVAAIYWRDLRRTRIYLPNFGLQVSFAERVRACDRQLTALRNSLLKHQELKQGLMDDLLTGRVRVPGAVRA